MQAINVDKNKEATIVLAHASHSKVYELKDVIADDSPRYSFYIWERKHGWRFECEDGL